MPDENEGLDFTYDSFLGQVPEAIRDQIEPAFKAYRDNLESGYNTQSEQFKPYQQIEEQGWTPEHVNVGLSLLQQINDNPQTVFNALVQEYPELTQQLQQQMPEQPPQFPQQNNNSSMDIPPELQQRLDQQEQIIQLMYKGFEQQQQALANQQSAEQEAQEIKQFNDLLDKTAPSDKYHRPFILSYIAQGQTPDQAVKSYNDWQTSEQQRWRSNGAPLVAPGSGGGLPSEPVDTSKLNDKDRASLITQYLEAANRQG